MKQSYLVAVVLVLSLFGLSLVRGMKKEDVITHQLFSAVSEGNIDRIKKLIENAGADVNAKGDLGNTPLREAVKRDNQEVVALLIDKGANVNAEGFHGDTPLHEAAFRGHANMVVFLIKKGAEVNAQDKEGETPLYRACNAGKFDVALRLVKRGADPFIKTKKGKSSLDVITNKEFKDTLEGAWKRRKATLGESLEFKGLPQEMIDKIEKREHPSGKSGKEE